MATVATILKIYFSLLLLNWKANCLETWEEALGWLVDQKELKSFNQISRMAAMATILKSYFDFSSWTERPNYLKLIGSIRVTYRSKIAKIPWWELYGRYPKYLGSLTLVLLNPDMPCFCKQCGSKSVRHLLLCFFGEINW